MPRTLLIALTLIVTGCSTLIINAWDDLYGSSDPARYDHPLPSPGISYQRQVKPILDQRCVVCHACYDAPCQLKLTAFEGIARGASKQDIYATPRLLAIEPTRLFQDALNTADWRKKGFYPVLNERSNTPEANLQASVMARLLMQKQNHPLPPGAVLPDSFDFKLHRDQQCTDIESYDSYLADYPLWGMPYGLPALKQQEHQTLIHWLEAGAPYEPPAVISDSLQAQVAKWETFFNQDSLQARLMSRYMYEHLYLAHLYFFEDSNPVFFDLVRSRTPAPEPIDLISTRRPYDDPGVKRVYYRLRRHQETVVAKTHMPYHLDQKRMEKWQSWFLNTDYEVTSLPGYQIKTASNPFIVFRQIPSYARYRFLLDEAQYTLMNFIKGPVCRGQVALNVINDHFWVTFLHPKYETADLNTDFLEQNANLLKLPARDNSSAGVLNWISYARNEQKFIEAKANYLNEHVDKNFKISLDLLWDGDGTNDNAALTIYRHFDSASVIKGLHGGKPQTAWVITYPLLERIHYLLVAGFDVFGNVGHQLNTRIYMDFLRMEGEFHFLTLLPKEARGEVRNRWYRGSVNPVKEHIYNYAMAFKGNSSIAYSSNDPLQELYLKLQEKLAPALNKEHNFDQGFTAEPLRAALSDLNNIPAKAASHMPQTAVLALQDKTGRTEYYSLLSNSAFSNISYLLGDEDRRLPQEDTLSVAYGLVGTYPNVLLKVSTAQLEEFVQQVARIQTDADYIKLLDQFAVRRTSPNFWAFSDELHHAYQQAHPISFGYLDFNRLENR